MVVRTLRGGTGQPRLRVQRPGSQSRGRRPALEVRMKITGIWIMAGAHTLPRWTGWKGAPAMIFSPPCRFVCRTQLKRSPTAECNRLPGYRTRLALWLREAFARRKRTGIGHTGIGHTGMHQIQARIFWVENKAGIAARPVRFRT